MSVSSKNLIVDNMMLAREFGEYKQHKFIETVENKTKSFCDVF